NEHSWNCQNGSEFQSTSSSRIFCRQFGKIARCLVRKSVNSSCEILPEKMNILQNLSDFTTTEDKSLMKIKEISTCR
ncbi:unnamed protein product, partial [Oikopleura dioica]